MDISKYLTDTCTYWAPSTKDEYGKKTFAAPVTYDCRFKFIDQQIVAGTGEIKMAQCEVWFEENAIVGGYLYNGESTEADPFDVDNAYEIMRFETINFKGSVIFRRAWC